MQLVAVLVLNFTLYSLCHSAILSRFKRQIHVNSDASTDGKGDVVNTDASAMHFKNENGDVGMNVTSFGNSTGHGTSSVENAAGGNVGNTGVNNSGNVLSTGNNAHSYSDIFAAVEGEKLALQINQKGEASGAGETFAGINGGGTLSNDNGQTKNGLIVGTAGGTGSLNSETQVSGVQAMSWDTLMAEIVAKVKASGYGNAQANIDLGAGTNNNNMAISGLISGTNSNNGSIENQASGTGKIDKDGNNVDGQLKGSAEGKGNTTLIGALSINSNSSSSSEVKSFGNSNIVSSGKGRGEMTASVGLENNTGFGLAGQTGEGSGANNTIIVSNGIKANDEFGESVGIGKGSVKGVGNDEHSDSHHSVETRYEDGEMSVSSEGNGKSMSEGGQNASLIINSNGAIANANGSSSVLSSGAGVAGGDKTRVVGSGSSVLSDSSSNANSVMEAFGQGNGSAFAETNAFLNFNFNGAPKNATVFGSVSASGTNTNVESKSEVSQNNNVQTLTNYQHATSSGSGSSGVSASNSGFLKRRKRFSFLLEKLNE